MNIQEKIAEVRSLEQEYLAHKYISHSENSLESIRTFGNWHSAAAVLFSDYIPADDKLLEKFVEEDTSGNAYVLAHVYDSLHTCYEILMSRVEKSNQESCVNNSTNEQSPVVFISHCSKDKDIIKSFIDNILKKGLNLTDKDIACTSFEATGVNPGDNIPAYIKRNIKGAKICLAMVSKNYKRSEVCLNEVGAAWIFDKKLVQVVLPDTDFRSLGWLLISDKAIRIDDKECLDSLEEILAEAIGIDIPTARHWNPCTKDFLKELSLLERNISCRAVEVKTEDGKDEIACTPVFYRVSYFVKRNIGSDDKIKSSPAEMLIKGSLCPEWIQELTKTTEAIVVKPKFTRKSINHSYCHVALKLQNNSDEPIVNGKIIIKATEESVSFSKSNVEEHNIAFMLNTRATQHVEINCVSESFPNPINPTASETLYDFFVTANPEIKEFDLVWKLETLSRHYEGKLHVVWSSSFEDKYEEVKADDSRIDTIVYADCIIEE